MELNECELYFNNLSSKTANGKKILCNLNGKFPSGSLIAIMGTSGAGKTTLLNILSGYRTQNITYDTFEINGTSTNFENMSKLSCYLTQDIYLNDLLTIEENMKFTADLKFGDSLSLLEKTKIIDELLDTFGLSYSRNTRAGNFSGGERKRLAVALEMIRDPMIICLDEPTTGLDILATNQVLHFLKKIANTGKTVICTIHQVSASHFKFFDHAYVITDGQCAYQGHPQDLVPFLESHGLSCNIYHNPADYVIELCSGDYGPDKSDFLVKVSKNGKTYIENDFTETKSLTNNKRLMEFDISWTYQCKTLIKREYTKLSRNKFLVGMRLIGYNIIAVSFGLIFWDIGNDASNILTNYMLSLALCSFVLLTGILYPILTLPRQIELLKREVYNKYYSVFQFYISVLIMDIPLSITTVSAVSMFIWYISGQLLELERILVFQLIIITFGCLLNVIGMFIGTLNVSLNTAMTVCGMTQLPMMVLSGFGMLYKDMHWLVEYSGRIMYFRNAVEGCLVSMMGLSPRRMECTADFCLYSDPHRFLLDIGVEPDQYLLCWTKLFIWFIVTVVLTYFSMKWRVSR